MSDIRALMLALNAMNDAINTRNEARDSYEGYSWGYHGQRYEEYVVEREAAFETELNEYIDARIDAKLKGGQHMKRWKDIPCELIIGICDYAPEVSTDDDERIRVLDGRVVNENELVIKATRTGYIDEGQWYKRNGDPGDPPESDDEAFLVEAYLTNGEARTDLPPDIQQDVFDQFYDRIMEIEIDYDYHQPD